MNELVYTKKNEVVCDSLQVAEKFHKRHDNVLQGIRGLLEIKDTHKMFQLSHYVEEQNGQSYPMYLMNRDGFSLLVMGFTGKKALEWKLKYIETFNTMEKLLSEKQTSAWIENRMQSKLIRKAETDVIKELVEYAKAQGSEHAEKLYLTYSKLANTMAGVTDRNLATTYQISTLSFIENIILNQIRAGMERGQHYKEIYQQCKKQIELFKDVAYLEAV